MLKEWKFNGVEYKFDWARKDDNEFTLESEGTSHKVQVVKRVNDHVVLVNINGKNHLLMKSGDLISIGPKTIEALDSRSRQKGAKSAGEEDMSSPMPGKILKVLVSEGDEVSAGQGLLVMEAMKMEHTIKAAFEGVVTKVHFKEGDLVGGGVDLVDLEKKGE
jgi:biotin carboxyl carrier protein